MGYIRNKNVIKLFRDFMESLDDYTKLQRTYVLEDPEYPEETEETEGPDFVGVDGINIMAIIEQIDNGSMDALTKFAEVKEYIVSINSALNDKHRYRRGWRYKYPELHPTVYGVEQEMLWVLEDLVLFLEDPLHKLFRIMMTKEKIGLAGVCRQCKLPTDIQYYISDYIGIHSKYS